MFRRNDSREIEAREKSEVATENTRPGLVFRPDVDILERPDAYVIHADMPGVNEKTVEIDLDKGILALNAQPAESEDPERFLHSEYRAGGYHREFRVSEDIDSAAVSATMKDGVLELLLPKSAEHQPRRIEVAGG
ncbi:MAG: Hsp20/alpha crystallin family protein [Proteobacteria bacterium]|nr:Hsp20/alpha crystallin family protein [Pseudomonadota bacterium]